MSNYITEISLKKVKSSHPIWNVFRTFEIFEEKGIGQIVAEAMNTPNPSYEPDFELKPDEILTIGLRKIV